MSTDRIEVEGEVTQIFRGDFYTVLLGNGSTVQAKRAGRMARNKIKIVLGDKCLVEISAYDLGRGRIIYRM